MTSLLFQILEISDPEIKNIYILNFSEHTFGPITQVTTVSTQLILGGSFAVNDL